jgi:hypothetical protein
MREIAAEILPMTDMHLSSSLLDQLEPHFTLRDANAVLAIIQSNTELIDLLHDARQVLPRYIPDAIFYLEAEEREQILLSVSTAMDWEAAYDAMRQFDKDWWMSQIHRANYKLNIHTEFR